MIDRRPPLVLVGGAPGSGKTTLAPVLARELGLPLLARDGIKEVLFDALGAPDRTQSCRLGGASYDLLFATAGWLLDAGVGAVVESNWRRGRSEAELVPLAARARTALVHCRADRAEVVRRAAARAADGSRHPGHHDAAALPEVLADLDAGRCAPLDLGPGVAVLTVETTAGYTPELGTVLRAIRAALGEGEE